jgi:parallel beta-helix repeat protein
MLIVDTTRINLFPQDLVDLVIIGPAGQIKIDKMNNQTFTNITVSQLMLFCDAGLKTEGWKVGNYTFQVKTRSANACGLKAASVIRILEILKGGDFIIIQHVHNINTGENFSSIQAAIDDNDTEDGHTITVYSGVYYENVVVNKSVTLIGIGHPVVDACGEGSAITLSADGITLVGFTATNSESSWGCAGIKVISSSNIITGNNVSSNNHDGIRLDYSSNNIITGNNVSNNYNDGIRLYDSSDNIITGNNVNNNWYGICLDYSSDSIITGNNVSSNNYDGIYLSDSRNNNITGNTFVNDGLNVENSYQNIVEENIVNGKPLVYLEDASNYKVADAGQVILVNCNNITVKNLDLSNTSVGIVLWKTENCLIPNNTVSNNNHEGIYLSNSHDNIITGNNASSNYYDGIRLYDSSDNIITGNNVSSNNHDGIHLLFSSDNIITGNNVNNNWYGICLDYSSNNNSITSNNVNNNGGGISLYDSSNNTFTGNNVCNNNWHGISLYDSSNNNTITGNVFVNDGLIVSSSYQNTVEENTVNGKHLVYLEDVSDYKVEDAGQVIIVNCDNITVENLDLSNTSGGIALWKTENSKISNNRVSNNNIGIGLYSSSNNTIIGNTANSNHWNGIKLWERINKHMELSRKNNLHLRGNYLRELRRQLLG